MSVIKTGFNATSLMKSVLEKSISPTDIAAMPSCLALSVFRDNFVDGDDVGNLVNLANPSINFTQSDDLSKPTLLDDVNLGRKSGYFNADANRYLNSEHVIDYSAAYTILSVVKIPYSTNDIQLIMGNESVTASNRVGVKYRGSNNKVQNFRGSSSVGSEPLIAGQWYAILSSYNGVDTVSMEVIGEPIKTSSVIETVTTTNLKISSGSGFTMSDGSIDMVAFFNKDMFDPSNSEDYDDINLMLKSFYGSSVSGL